MILIQFQAMLQFNTHLKHQKTRDQEGIKAENWLKMGYYFVEMK